MKFTDWSIKSLKPKESRYTVFADGQPGFALRVSPSGTKTWLYRHYVDGKQRWTTIGTYPDKTLSEAAAEYAAMRKDFRQDGKAPVSLRVKKARARAQRRQEPTFSDLADEYIQKYAKPKKKSWEEDKRMLDKIVLPYIGSEVKAKDIRRRDLVLLLEDVGERAPVASNRVRALLSKLFNFAMEREIIEASPVAALKNLYKEKSKERYLNREEIALVWSKLEVAPNTTREMRQALRFILCTAARPGEVAAMSWDEINGEWWNLSGERMKNGLPHRCYLNPMAREILKGQKEDQEQLEKKPAFVFPSPITVGAPIQPKNLSRPLRRNEYFGMPRFTPHDLRRTAATHLGEMGVQRLVVGQILGHTDGSITTVYDRHSFDKEKKQAMMKWDRQLRRILTGSVTGKKVIQLPEGRMI